MNDQEKQAEIERLSQIIREGSNKEALAAVDELRAYGWLSDGSLEGANLVGADLHNANLQGANLHSADLDDTNLRDADLTAINLKNANLNRADLTRADLHDGDLREAKLIGADLIETTFSRANLSWVNLRDANLSRATLIGTILNDADLSRANFTGVKLGYGSLGNVDLSSVKDLATVNHRALTKISLDTLYRSRGKIPEVFLRDCGVPPEFIEHTKGLFGENTIQFFDCFISYSHADKDFAQRLHDRLYGAGINCWLDERDVQIGDFFEDKINQALRIRERVIVCCSHHSLNSDWVEYEINVTLEREQAENKDRLSRESHILPLNIDDYLFDPACGGFVAAQLKKRLAADFTDWKDHDAFEREVEKVIRALRTDGGKPPPPTPKL